jgi:hypothetical protein
LSVLFNFLNFCREALELYKDGSISKSVLNDMQKVSFAFLSTREQRVSGSKVVHENVLPSINTNSDIINLSEYSGAPKKAVYRIHTVREIFTGFLRYIYDAVCPALTEDSETRKPDSRFPRIIRDNEPMRTYALFRITEKIAECICNVYFFGQSRITYRKIWAVDELEDSCSGEDKREKHLHNDDLPPPELTFAAPAKKNMMVFSRDTLELPVKSGSQSSTFSW